MEPVVNFLLHSLKITSIALSCAIFLSGYAQYRNLVFPLSVSVVPIVCMFTNCAYWFTYGVYGHIIEVCVNNGFGIICAVYYAYLCAKVAQDVRFYVRVGFGFVVYVSGIVLIFGYLDSREERIKWIGIVSSTMSVLLFASPLASLVKIIQKRDSSIMPIQMSVASLMCTTSWSLFAIIFGDLYILVPNVLGFVFSVISIAVYYVFKKETNSTLLPMHSEENKQPNEIKEQQDDEG